jgi:hypothetical protein
MDSNMMCTGIVAIGKENLEINEEAFDLEEIYSRMKESCCYRSINHTKLSKLKTETFWRKGAKRIQQRSRFAVSATAPPVPAEPRTRVWYQLPTDCTRYCTSRPTVSPLVTAASRHPKRTLCNFIGPWGTHLLVLRTWTPKPAVIWRQNTKRAERPWNPVR